MARGRHRKPTMWFSVIAAMILTFERIIRTEQDERKSISA